MISHEHRCIFVHIPRCAGTSVETWICGRNWWGVDRAAKHLTAGQARRRYAEWWDDYFKFSIVRDPYARTRSLLKYADHFGLRKQPDGSIDFSGYESLFGRDVIIEHDHRFGRREDVMRPSHRPGCVYGNMLDEDLDFVGRVETLHRDMEFVRARLGIAAPLGTHVERSDETGREDLTEADRAWVAAAYDADFYAYGYRR